VRPELVDYMVGMRELQRLQALGLVQGRPNQDMITALGRAVLDARGPDTDPDPAPSPEQRAFLIRYKAEPGGRGLVERTPEEQAKYRAKLDRWYGAVVQDQQQQTDNLSVDRASTSPGQGTGPRPAVNGQGNAPDQEQLQTAPKAGLSRTPDVPDIADGKPNNPGQGV
jgi:hypothetical protein